MGNLKQEDRQTAEEFKNLLINRGVPLVRTVVFGSRARGEAEWDSDFDILVVLKRLDKAIDKTVSRCAWEIGFSKNLVITPVVFTEDELENGPERSSLLMLAVEEDGVVL